MDRPTLWDYALLAVVIPASIFYIGPWLATATGYDSTIITMAVVVAFFILHRLYKMWTSGDKNASE